MEPIQNSQPYVQGDKVAEAGSRFEHVMALALDPRTNYQEGVIRCIVSREGDVQAAGYIDRSELHIVRANDQGGFAIGERLRIKNEEEVLGRFGGEDWECLGLEDPDVFVDEEAGVMHLYFTLPFRNNQTKQTVVHLGHSVGQDLQSLEMTEPVLLAQEGGKFGAKEVSIAPENSNGERLHLFESSDKSEGIYYSTIRMAKALDAGGKWEFGNVVFHPKEHDITWVGEHASPGPLLPRSFVDVGQGRLLGILNGREKSEKISTKTIYKDFTVGLCVYDYEMGRMLWVSPEYLIKDADAQTITFASQFVEIGPGKGVLYAHVDDSFVRSYILNAEGIKKLIPPEYINNSV